MSSHCKRRGVQLSAEVCIPVSPVVLLLAVSAIALLDKIVFRFPQMYLNSNPKDNMYCQTYGLEPVDCGSLILDAPQIAAVEKGINTALLLFVLVCPSC
ncbi:hypothetical protein EMCRGX_G016627 [Ephydatia muelleri]